MSKTVTLEIPDNYWGGVDALSRFTDLSIEGLMIEAIGELVLQYDNKRHGCNEPSTFPQLLKNVIPMDYSQQ